MPVPTPMTVKAYQVNTGDMINGRERVEAAVFGRRNMTFELRKPSGRVVKRAYPQYQNIDIVRQVRTLEERVASSRAALNSSLESAVDGAKRRATTARTELASKLNECTVDLDKFTSDSLYTRAINADALWMTIREALAKPINDGMEPVLAWAAYRDVRMSELMSRSLSYTPTVIGVMGESEMARERAKDTILRMAQNVKLLEEVIEAAQIEAHANG